MGGTFVADDEGRVTLRVELPDGSSRTITLDGYDPGAEVYADLINGRWR